jgi:hypothetical protein
MSDSVSATRLTITINLDIQAEQIQNRVTSGQLDSLNLQKADIALIYSRTYLDARFSHLVDADMLSLKADISAVYTKNNVYNRQEMDQALAQKLDRSNFTPDSIKTELEKIDNVHLLTDDQLSSIHTIPQKSQYIANLYPTAY